MVKDMQPCLWEICLLLLEKGQKKTKKEEEAESRLFSSSISKSQVSKIFGKCEKNSLSQK